MANPALPELPQFLQAPVSKSLNEVAPFHIRLQQIVDLEVVHNTGQGFLELKWQHSKSLKVITDKELR
jgi:hypothetical protein